MGGEPGLDSYSMHGWRGPCFAEGMHACFTKRDTWLVVVLSAAALAAAACSAPPTASDLAPGAPRTNPSPTEPSKPGTKAQGGACSLSSAGFTFERAGGGGGACDQCIESTCCADVVGCFKGNADCAELNACVDKCQGGGAATGDGGTGGGGGDGGGGGGATNPAAKANFVGTVYPSVNPTCGSCHGVGGTGPQFFGTTADTTYQMFKINQFHANNVFTGKGAHAGPALTANQLQIVQQWKTLEAQGGGGTGGGGGGGTGGGTGGGPGGNACVDACYAAHPASADMQKSFYQCRTVTCTTACQ